MPPLQWSHRCVDIGENPLKVEREATREECRAVAGALAVPDCAAILARYQVREGERGRYLVHGVVDTRIEQLCGVSLEPVQQDISVDFKVEFWPQAQLQAREREEVDVDDLDVEDPEPIENGGLDVGRLVYELIASNLDPYPRKAGEELERHSAGDDAAAANPFAALASLKRE